MGVHIFSTQEIQTACFSKPIHPPKSEQCSDLSIRTNYWTIPKWKVIFVFVSVISGLGLQSWPPKPLRNTLPKFRLFDCSMFQGN